MILASETFNGTFPFAPHFNDASGFRMHYVDEGPRDGEVVLCLHGEPTWGFLFRALIRKLSQSNRVVVPDHMGFGKSAAPRDRTYWLQDHIDNIEKFVLALDLRDISLVMHDFGGPVGMGLAARHPGRIRRIISVNGPTPFGQADLFERLVANSAASPWFQWISKAETEGTLEATLGQLGFNILSVLKLNGFENNSIITPSWLSAYGSPFRSASDCAGAIGWAKGFATEAHQFEMPSAAAKKTICALPAMAIWGDADRTLCSAHMIPLFRDLFPQAPVHRLSGVGHYSLEDAPEDVFNLIAAFVEQT